MRKSRPGSASSGSSASRAPLTQRSHVGDVMATSRVAPACALNHAPQRLDAGGEVVHRHARPSGCAAVGIVAASRREERSPCGPSRPAALAALLAAALLACTGDGDDAARDERLTALEARTESLADENAALRAELDALRAEQAATPAPAEPDARRANERLDDLDARVRELEAFASDMDVRVR